MKLLLSLSGRSQKWFDELTKKDQKAYLKDHPNSKFGQKKAKPAAKKTAAKKAPAKKPAAKKPAAKKAPTAGKSRVKSAKVDTKLMDYDDEIARLEKDAAKDKAKGIPTGQSGSIARLRAVKALRAGYLKRKETAAMKASVKAMTPSQVRNRAEPKAHVNKPKTSSPVRQKKLSEYDKYRLGNMVGGRPESAAPSKSAPTKAEKIEKLTAEVRELAKEQSEAFAHNRKNPFQPVPTGAVTRKLRAKADELKALKGGKSASTKSPKV